MGRGKQAVIEQRKLSDPEVESIAEMSADEISACNVWVIAQWLRALAQEVREQRIKELEPIN